MCQKVLTIQTTGVMFDPAQYILQTKKDQTPNKSVVLDIKVALQITTHQPLNRY